MRRLHSFVVLAAALLLAPTASSAQPPYTVYGGEPRQPKEPGDPSTPSDQNSAILRNADVIAMTSLGLSDEVIIEKIRSAAATEFDTGLEGLKALKASRVSDLVIRAMINPKASMGNTNASVGVGGGNSGLIPEEVGIYVLSGEGLVRVQPEQFQMGSEGVLLSDLTYGAKRAYLRGKIENADSSLHLPARSQEFVIRAPDGYLVEDYRLYKLSEKKDSRELRIVDVGRWFAANRNALDRDALPFAAEKLDIRTWRIKLNLEKGEYGFIGMGHVVPNPSGEMSPRGQIYTFAVR